MINLHTQILKRLKGLLVKRPGLALGLWGEAGIGKTHTTQNLLQEIPCKNLSQHSTTSLANLVRVLPKPKKLPIWAERILEKLERDEVLSSEQTTSALGAVLLGIAPFILHLEDIHEASLERLEWITTMANMVTHLKGVSLIVTSRTEPPEPFEAIRLEKLEFEAVKNLLENEARASLPTEAMEWIYAKAAGNPLFTLEFFRLLARQGFVWNDGKKWRWRVPKFEFTPSVVEALIEQQLLNASTTPELQIVLAAKAMLPKNVSLQVWETLTNLSPQAFQEAQVELERYSILVHSEFAHPLYQETLKRTLSSEKRLDLANHALKIFETDPQNRVLFVNDAKLEPERALEILTNTAAQFETLGKTVAAAQTRLQALEYAVGETKIQLSLEAARALINSPNHIQALALLEQVVSSDHAKHKNKALVLMAEYHARAGQRIAMNASLERLPKAYQKGAEWFAKYIHILFDSADYNAAIEYWEQHPEHQTAPKGLTIYQVAYAQIEQGKLEQAQMLANTWLERENLSLEDQSQGLDVLTTAAFYQGNYAKAELLFTQLLNTYKAEENPKDYSNCLRNRAVNRLQLGHYAQSLPDFEESIRIDQERGLHVICAQTKIMASAVYLEFGQFEQTEQILLEGLEVLKPIEPQAFLIYGLVCLSLLYLRWQPAHGMLLAQKYALQSSGLTRMMKV